jgi:hypothetical protein
VAAGLHGHLGRLGAPPGGARGAYPRRVAHHEDLGVGGQREVSLYVHSPTRCPSAGAWFAGQDRGERALHGHTCHPYHRARGQLLAVAEAYPAPSDFCHPGAKPHFYSSGLQHSLGVLAAPGGEAGEELAERVQKDDPCALRAQAEAVVTDGRAHQLQQGPGRLDPGRAAPHHDENGGSSILAPGGCVGPLQYR